jgi:hypothetical protein
MSRVTFNLDGNEFHSLILTPAARSLPLKSIAFILPFRRSDLPETL